MLNRLVAVIFLCGVSFSAPAFSQAFPDCPQTIALDGLEQSATADILDTPMAFPGAFGGTVACILKKTDEGQTLKFMIEVLPTASDSEEDITYSERSISFNFRVAQPGARASELAACYKLDNGGFYCFADVSGGSGVMLDRFWTPEQQLESAAVIVVPAWGATQSEVWQGLPPEVQANPKGHIKVSIVFPEKEQSIPLFFKTNNTLSAPMFELTSDAGRKLMKLIVDDQPKIEIRTTVLTLVDGKVEESISVVPISPATVGYMVGRMRQIEYISAIGYEASKSHKF